MNYKFLLAAFLLPFTLITQAEEQAADPYNAFCFCLINDTTTNKELFALFHPQDIINAPMIKREKCVDDIVIYELVKNLSAAFCDDLKINLDVLLVQEGDTADLLIPVNAQTNARLQIQLEEGLQCTQACLVPLELFKILFGQELVDENKSASPEEEIYINTELDQFDQYPDELPAILKRTPTERTVLQQIMRGFVLYYYSYRDYLSNALADLKNYVW